MFEFGECQFQNAQYGNATAIFLWAAELSADPMVYNKLGKNYQALKQYDRAEKAYVQAAHMIPHRIYPLYLLALLYREMGDMEKARDMARQVIQKEPKVMSDAVKEMKAELEERLRFLLTLNNKCDDENPIFLLIWLVVAVE